jgi:hypothetical protein
MLQCTWWRRVQIWNLLSWDLFIFSKILTTTTDLQNFLKNAVFWDVATCRSCVNWRFGGTYCLRLQGRKICERGTKFSRWIQTTLKMEPIRSSETSVHTRSTPRHIPEDGIIYSHHCENLKSYNIPFYWDRWCSGNAIHSYSGGTRFESQ